MRNLFKYLPLLMEITPHIQVLTDGEVLIPEKADHLLQVLGILAEETENELDDLLVERVRELANTPDFWDTIDRIVSFFRDDVEPQAFGSMMEQEKEMNPATIILIVEVVGLLVKMWRKRRNG